MKTRLPGFILAISFCFASSLSIAQPQPTPPLPDPTPGDAGQTMPHAQAQAPALQTLPDGTPVAPCIAPAEGMSCIPGGKFLRGANGDKHNLSCKQPSNNDRSVANTYPQQEIWLQTFYMDKTEVTNEAYNACVKAGKCVKSGPKYVDFDRPKQPITGISWYEANDYCKAQGKHLPTEAEWEKAARGADGDLYPWGNGPISCENAVIMNEKGRSCGQKKEKGKNPDTGRVLEVCSRGAFRYDLCDMAGNAEEWVADWYSKSYGLCGKDCEGINPKGPCNGDDGKKCGATHAKVVRGGAWYWPAEHATGIHRRSHLASNNPGHHFGFRCAASPEETEKLTKK